MHTSRQKFGQGTVRLFLLLLVLSLWIPATTVFSLNNPTDLFISEYIEGSSNNKAIEIYNTTGAPVDLGAGNYNVQMFFNGNPVAGLTISLTGTLASNDVFVLAHASADPAILAVADQTNNAGWFNGDDAVVLRKDLTIIDSIGQAGFDPGTEWGTGLTSTADNTLVRKPTFCTSDANATDAFNPALEWDGFATNTFTNLGTYECIYENLIFSEYIEGSSNNKALEIYNGTGTAIDFAVSNYSVQVFFNGSATAGLTINLTGTLAHGDVFVLAHSSANTTILGVADQTNGAGWFNGDDAVVLRQGTTVIDSIGQIGSDPGTEWGTGLTSTADNTLRRKENILLADTNTGDAFNPAIAWNGFAVDTFDDLGCYRNSCNDNEPPPPPEPELAFIHEIQGAGTSVVNPGTAVIVNAIIVADFSANNQFDGYYIQEEDADADANPLTSEGIFVYCGADNCGSFPANVGDHVTVTGVQEEFFNQSQIDLDVEDGELVVNTSGNPLPTAASIDLPIALPDRSSLALSIEAAYEPYEGMLVHYVDDLAVAEYFQLARFGEVVLYEGGRPYQYTHFADAITPEGFAAHERELASRRVLLDDDNNIENGPALYYPQPGGFSTTNFFRGGDTVSDLTGVLAYSFNRYRVLPLDYAPAEFIATNPRLAAPVSDGSVTVASFNVLNYFLSVDTADTCSPTQDEDCRGADSLAELDRQTDKLVSALNGLNADIYGLIEMENTPDVEPLAYLVDELNSSAGAGTYNYIHTGVIGTDAIRVGIIYDTTTVEPVGQTAVLDDLSFVRPFGGSIDRNRPALAQSFREIETGAVFTVVVNHLKSKGSGCGDGDDDPIQGSCNGTRAASAQVLADWLETDPTGVSDSDYLLIGDYNAYANEDPINVLEAAGYTDLNRYFHGLDAYSYVFDGQIGYLDYALSSTSLTSQVADVAEWHINADEVPVLDYNDSVWDIPGESDFEAEPEGITLYEVDPFRTSDHDPVFVGLNLIAPVVTAADPVSPVNEGTNVSFSASVANFNTAVTYRWDVNSDGNFDALGNPVNVVLDDGDKVLTVTVEACDALLTCVTDTTTIEVLNVAPILAALYTVPVEPLFQGETVRVLFNITDPSEADTNAGFTISADCTTETAIADELDCFVPTNTNNWSISGTAVDKDGGSDSNTLADIEVLNTADAINHIISVIQNTSGLNNGQKNSLISKLTHIQQNLNNDNLALNQLNAFMNQVIDLQATGVISVDDMNNLLGLADRLGQSISNS